MLTKTQKTEHVDLARQQIKKSKAIIFADFSGISDADTKALKKQLRQQGAHIKIFKKRLLKVALAEAGIEFDPLQQERLLATIFSESNLTEIASNVAKFSKQFKDTEGSHFEIIDAYDGERAALIGKDEFTIIASLPSREVLLAMVMGGFSGPLRAFMSIVKQLSEKAPGAEEKPTEEKKEETPVEETKTESSAPAEAEHEKVADSETQEGNQ
ncbi:MAG: 50S ribosomal protein L10 [Candidatus Harrisonbacteria bacterium]|nr:50S ribosomal protein L10 [Candidatus Harrisonbacteria bacterium]